MATFPQVPAGLVLSKVRFESLDSELVEVGMREGNGGRTRKPVSLNSGLGDQVGCRYRGPHGASLTEKGLSLSDFRPGGIGWLEIGQGVLSSH